jgi:hypothetical protein
MRSPDLCRADGFSTNGFAHFLTMINLTSHQAVIERLIDAADSHAEDAGDPDHAVGDLQQMLRKAFSLMMPSQRLAFIESQEACDVIETGAREEFDAADLSLAIDAIAKRQYDEVLAISGYTVVKGQDGFFWEINHHCRVPLPSWADAVDDCIRIMDEAAQSVAEDVIARVNKHQFNPTGAALSEAVADSAGILRLELNDYQHSTACSLVRAALG